MKRELHDSMDGVEGWKVKHHRAKQVVRKEKRQSHERSWRDRQKDDGYAQQTRRRLRRRRWQGVDGYEECLR